MSLTNATFKKMKKFLHQNPPSACNALSVICHTGLSGYQAATMNYLLLAGVNSWDPTHSHLSSQRDLSPHPRSHPCLFCPLSCPPCGWLIALSVLGITCEDQETSHLGGLPLLEIHLGWSENTLGRSWKALQWPPPPVSYYFYIPRFVNPTLFWSDSTNVIVHST